MTETEQQYAQIEKELLAIVHGFEKFHSYVYGRGDVMVVSDHKPLLAIHKKALVSAPKRLQRMLLRLQRYTYNLTYQPGSQLVIADTLSRAYPPEPAVKTQFPEDIAALGDVEQEQLRELHMVASADTLNLIQNAAIVDVDYQLLIHQIKSGWPETQEELPVTLKPYYTFADELSVCGGFVLKGHRLVIPQPAREVMLERLHRAHIGVNGILRRAREVAFYPGITTDIKRAAERCEICARHREETQKEPLLPHQPPLRPWEKVEVDIFTFVDIDYVITVDYLSGFFEVDRLPSKSVKDIIYHLRQHFCRHGLQLEVCTDNSPFGAREFKIDKLFAQRCDFLHVTSSPRYPQSNGRVENAVKTAKHLMKKATEAGEDVFLALLDWRNTPAEQLGQSPAQLLFNRRTRTSLPTASPLLDATTSSAANIALTAAKAKQAYYYNKGAKEKPPFAVGQTVRMKFDDKSEW